MSFFKSLTRHWRDGSMSTSEESQRPLLSHDGSSAEEPRRDTRSQREDLQQVLSSKSMHYLILGLVALDVTALMANIFLELFLCDSERKPEPWIDPLQDSLKLAGLVFSSVFLLELLLCIAAFGIRYFADWFHCLDAAVIIASFVVDLLSHGIVEDIASLVIVFRLFRFVKLVEEMSVGASVEMESMKKEMDQLQSENRQLRSDLAQARGEGQV